MSGSVVRYTGGSTPDEGINVFLSPEVRDRIKSAISTNCQEVTNDCVQSVKDVISSPNTELQARFIITAGAVGAIIAGVVEVFAWITSIVAVYFTFLGDVSKGVGVPPFPEYVHIPPSQVSQLTSVAAATVTVVMANDAPTVTITPKPVPIGVTG